MLRRIMMMLALLISAFPALAQSGGGQVCVRAFEDRNTNGTFDAGEPLITRGVSANLIDANGIIVSTATLEDSQLAANGLICFQRLTGGQYSLNVVSAAYNATGSNIFTTVVDEVGAPDVFDFPARLVVSESATVTTNVTNVNPAEREAILQGLLFGTLGAAIVTMVMVVVGVILYFLIFAGRVRELRQAQAYATGHMRAVPQTGSMMGVPPTTGSMRAVPPADSGPHRPVQLGDSGSYPPVNPDDDTGQFRPV